MAVLLQNINGLGFHFNGGYNMGHSWYKVYH